MQRWSWCCTRQRRLAKVGWSDSRHLKNRHFDHQGTTDYQYFKGSYPNSVGTTGTSSHPTTMADTFHNVYLGVELIIAKLFQSKGNLIANQGANRTFLMERSYGPRPAPMARKGPQGPPRRDWLKKARVALARDEIGAHKGVFPRSGGFAGSRFACRLRCSHELTSICD